MPKLSSKTSKEIKIGDKIEVVADYGNIPYGSVFELTSTTCKFLMGTWASMHGTWFIAVPKELCKLHHE